MKQFESFQLDTANQCLWREGEQITLPPKPYAVLRYLVENPARLISHDELLDKLWPETYVQPQVLRTYVLDLRKVLGDDAAQPRFIQTLPKRGYCFVAAVTEKACSEPRSERAAAVLHGSDERFIIGRDEELARLQAQVEQLSDGQRRVLFIMGEAGIGKTRLVDAFCRRIEKTRSATLARGQCVQGIGGREDYYPVMEALGHLCASPDADAACKVLRRIAPAWLGFGVESAAQTGAAGQTGNPKPERKLGDLCAALEEIAATRPLILVLEDLEWSDECTLNLVSALARRRAATKLMLVVTARPLKGSADHPLKALRQDLRMRKLGVEMVLEPLRKKAVKELLRSELKQEDLPAELDGFVLQRAEGNPLFVIAILEHLISERALVREADETAKWELRGPVEQMEIQVPGELTQMVELEIERMSAEEQSLLEAASLMGIAFPCWAIAAALNRDAGEVEEACDALAQRFHFVERAGEDELPDGSRSAFYVFVHGMYREVLYRRQTPSRRDKRHVRIAERLKELFRGREGDVAREIALHYEAAGAAPVAVS